MVDERAMLAELSRKIPDCCQWATGSGTKRSFAQIIPPNRRNFSWFALAHTESAALEAAITKMESDSPPVPNKGGR